MARSSTLSCALVLLLALGASTVGLGCAAPAEEDAGEGGDAMTLARGELAPMAKKAKDLADALSKAGLRAGAPTALPLPGEVPSRAYKAWNVAAITAADGAFLGFMFLPRVGAPAGSFGVVLADPGSKIVALSAYVPDSAPDASGTATAILDALGNEAPAVASAAGSVQTQGFWTSSPRLIEEGVDLAMRLLSGLSKGKAASKAVLGAEAHLATKVESSVWNGFTQLMGDRKAVGQLLADLASVRIGFGSRRVILLETSSVGKTESSKLTALLTRMYGGQTKKIGLAMRDTGDNAEAIVWALERDVPIVLSTLKSTAAEALENSWRGIHGSYASYERLFALMSDPKKVALVRVVPVETSTNVAVAIEHQEFVSLWAMADEALGVRFAGQTDSAFLAWLPRFEISTVSSL
jgi:hypothetical protein